MTNGFDLVGFLSKNISLTFLVVPLILVGWDAAFAHIFLQSQSHVKRLGYAVYMSGYSLFAGFVLRNRFTSPERMLVMVTILLILGGLLPFLTLLVTENRSFSTPRGPTYARMIGFGVYSFFVYLIIVETYYISQ